MSAQALRPGASVGGYRIEHVLRTDAAGELYRAAQPELDRTVAVLVAAHAADSEAGRRFADVARRLAGLEHPGLLPVYEVGVDDGRPFAVLRDVQGERLGDLLADGPLPTERAVAVAIDLAGALDALADAGLAPARLDPASVVLAPEQAYLAPVVEAQALGAGSSAPALAELLGSMVGRAGELAHVVDEGRAGRYPSAGALAADARRATAPGPGRRGRVGLLVTLGVLAVVAVVIALVASGEEEQPARAQTSSVNTPAGRVTARIPLNAEPGSAAAAEGAVWVATRDGTVLRVDPVRDEVLGAPIRFMPPRRGENVTVRAGAGGVFVLDGSGGRVTRIDPRSGRVTGRVRLGGTLDGATVADGSVWVTQTARDGLGHLVRLDPGSLRTVSRTPGGWAGAAFDVEVAGGAAWVMNAGTGTVIRIDVATGERLEVQPNAQPLGAAVLDDRIWIPDPLDGTVTPLDLRDPELPERVARPDSPFAVTATSDALWVASSIEPRPDAPIRLHRVDPELLRSIGRPVELGRTSGWPTAGFGAIWLPDAAGRQLVKVEPTDPAPAPAEPEEAIEGQLMTGPVNPGEWRVPEFLPSLTLEIGERGWVSRGVAEGFDLARFDEPGGATLSAVTLFQAFRGDGGIRRLRRVSDLVDSLRSHPGLRIVAQERTTVGGLPALQLTVALRDTQRKLERCTRPCAPLFPLRQGTWVLEAPTRLRLSALESSEPGVLVILEESSPGGGFAHTEPIVQTLRVGD